MYPPNLKVSEEKRNAGTTRGETAGATVPRVNPIERRPLPVIRPRHLDVNEILERSLPRLPDAV